MREVAHSSYQAWSYAAYIEDFNENVQRDNVKLLPCAYLHNYENVEPKTILSDKYKGYIEKALKLADEIIKNTYRTLMTRGQKGCYIYCEDKTLAEYLKSRINRCSGIIYGVDEDNESDDLMVAEASEEYRYE